MLHPLLIWYCQIQQTSVMLFQKTPNHYHIPNPPYCTSQYIIQLTTNLALEQSDRSTHWLCHFSDGHYFIAGIEQGIEKLSEIYSQGTGLKESYERQVLVPEVHQGPFFWYVTCGWCPGTSPWPPPAAKAFLLQGSSDCSRSILAAVPWLCHHSLLRIASSCRNTQLLSPLLSEQLRGAEMWLQQLETLLPMHIQLLL